MGWWIARLGATIAMGWSGNAVAQDALLDPAGSGVMVSAVRWLEGALLGTVATVVAVIAVASVGFLMLTGRTNWRYGVTVILGCFILFGAPNIAAGIVAFALGDGTHQASNNEVGSSHGPYQPSFPTPRATPSGGYDPYAGASLPPR